LQDLVIAESLPDHEWRYLTLKNGGLQLFPRVGINHWPADDILRPKASMILLKEIDRCPLV
jgi:hypothetical protein